MLCSVGDFIDTGIDDQMAAMQDSTLENFDDDFEEEDMDQDDIQKWVFKDLCWIIGLNWAIALRQAKCEVNIDNRLYNTVCCLGQCISYLNCVVHK